MKKISRRLQLAGVSVAAVAAVGAGSISAQAADSTSTIAKSAVTNAGIPAAVSATTGLASQGAGAGSDSIYITSHVKAHGHTFGVLVQTVNVADRGAHIMSVSVSDQTTGWYQSYQVPVASNQYSWSTTGLNITMPGMTWTGDAKNIHVQATTPWGALDLNYESEGPVLNYAGTGQWNMLGTPQTEYALPNLKTTGTLTVEGKTEKVTGTSWLDRQWGQLPLGPGNHWTWMNISLSNGDKVAIWDTVGSTAENSWATVLHPDGSYELATVTPLADSSGDVWKSPSSGNSYPTRWQIKIPSLKADLTVRIAGTDAQELGGGQMARMEATATATGTFEGKRVTGWNYVEMVGAF